MVFATVSFSCGIEIYRDDDTDLLPRTYWKRVDNKRRRRSGRRKASSRENLTKISRTKRRDGPRTAVDGVIIRTVTFSMWRQSFREKQDDGKKEVKKKNQKQKHRNRVREYQQRPSRGGGGGGGYYVLWRVIRTRTHSTRIRTHTHTYIHIRRRYIICIIHPVRTRTT